MIIVNCKTYEEATGPNAVALARRCARVAAETGIPVIPAVQAADIAAVAAVAPPFAQHADAVAYGAHTGAQLPEALKGAGASGSLVNHSERRIGMAEVEACVQRLKRLGMTSVVCAANDEEGKNVARFSPDYVAVEPPELIGGGVSVSTAKPGLIRNAVKKIPCTVLVGAGIRNGDDVRAALRLGAKGILVASGVVKAKDHEQALRGLAAGFG